VHLLVDALFRLFRGIELGDALAQGVELGGLVVLGQAEFLLDRLQLLAQEELTLLLGHFLVDLLANLRLQAGDVELLLQQHQHLFHALLQGKRLKHLLQVMLGCGGQAGGEIGELRRLVRSVAVEEELQFLRIQRVERQQFLDGVDDGDGVGADYLGIRLARLVRVFHPNPVGRRVGNPLDDAEAAYALGDELHLALGLDRVMDAHRGADTAKVRALYVVGVVGLDHHQAHHVVRRVADGRHRGQPRRLVHQQRQGLRGEKWFFGQRQQIQLGR
jgi:hypothetical protein